MNAVSGQAGKYARFELERRFLVSRLPKGFVEDRSWRISDRYIHNTHVPPDVQRQLLDLLAEANREHLDRSGPDAALEGRLA